MHLYCIYTSIERTYSLTTIILLFLLNWNLIFAQTDDCSHSQQAAGLAVLWQQLGGVSWEQQGNWGKSQITCQPRVNLTLPAYCCWSGVTCCEAQACRSRAAYDPACNCTDGTVTSIDLSNNGLTGNFSNLPPVFYSTMACSLRQLDLSNNSISATIAMQLTVLSKLEQLNLANNGEWILWCGHIIGCRLACTLEVIEPYA